MAFEPTTSIAQIMQNAAGTWKSPLSKLSEGYMRGREMKQQAELMQMKRDEITREQQARERDAQAFERMRPQIAQAFGVAPESLPAMDLEDAKQLFDLHSKASGEQRDRAAQVLEQTAGRLYSFNSLPAAQRKSAWPEFRASIVQEHPDAGKNLPERYDEAAINSMIATAQFGRDIMKQQAGKSAEAAAAKPTESNRKMQELMSLGVPAEVAQGLAYGTFRSVTDPQSGATLIVDLRTSQPIGRMVASDPENPYTSSYVWQPAQQQYQQPMQQPMQPQSQYQPQAPMGGSINRGGSVRGADLQAPPMVTGKDPLGIFR